MDQLDRKRGRATCVPHVASDSGQLRPLAVSSRPRPATRPVQVSWDPVSRSRNRADAPGLTIRPGAYQRWSAAWTRMLETGCLGIAWLITQRSRVQIPPSATKVKGPLGGQPGGVLSGFANGFETGSWSGWIAFATAGAPAPGATLPTAPGGQGRRDGHPARRARSARYRVSSMKSSGEPFSVRPVILRVEVPLPGAQLGTLSITSRQ
jgi:hypothetical protein